MMKLTLTLKFFLLCKSNSYSVNNNYGLFLEKINPKLPRREPRREIIFRYVYQKIQNSLLHVKHVQENIFRKFFQHNTYFSISHPSFSQKKKKNCCSPPPA